MLDNTLKPKKPFVRDTQAHKSTQPTPQSSLGFSVVKAEFGEIVEHIKDVVFQTDEHFNYSFLNESWSILTGFTLNETIGYLIFHFIHPLDLPAFVDTLNSGIAEQNSIETEIRLLHKNEDTIVVELFLKPIFNEYGNLIGTVGTMKNITLRKKEEEALRLVHEALKKSDKEAQRLNLELETFMYKSSHDLLGPLASIHGLLVLAKEQDNHPETVSYLKMITQSANQLMVTLENLLEISKIKQGKPQITAVNFQEILQEITDLLTQRAEFDQVEFIKQIDLKSVFYSDKNLIFSILYRLLENAFAYRRTNIKSYVYVSIVGSDKGVRLQITDNGQGMIEEVKDKIFDMFFKGNEINHGSGLGLYIVKNALEKLNGTIEVTSQERKGSMFIVHIPTMT